MIGVKCRVTSGKVGISRVMSGKVGRIFFFRSLFSLRFCISFFVSRVDSRFWHVLYDAHPLLYQTAESCRFAGGGGSASSLGGSCRVRSGCVGSERAVFLFWTLAPVFVHVSSLSLLRNRFTGFRASIASLGPSCAFRFPASGSLGISMTIRAQRRLFSYR